MILTTVKSNKSKDVEYDFENNPDKEFMIECQKVIDNKPETWSRYSNDPMSIVTMEYNELLKTKDTESKIREIYHLSASLLNLWRTLK